MYSETFYWSLHNTVRKLELLFLSMESGVLEERDIKAVCGLSGGVADTPFCFCRRKWNSSETSSGGKCCIKPLRAWTSLSYMCFLFFCYSYCIHRCLFLSYFLSPRLSVSLCLFVCMCLCKKHAPQPRYLHFNRPCCLIIRVTFVQSCGAIWMRPTHMWEKPAWVWIWLTSNSLSAHTHTHTHTHTNTHTHTHTHTHTYIHWHTNAKYRKINRAVSRGQYLTFNE